MAPELELKCKFQYNMEACVPQQWKINKYYISSTNNLPPCLKSSYSADMKHIKLTHYSENHVLNKHLIKSSFISCTCSMLQQYFFGGEIAKI